MTLLRLILVLVSVQLAGGCALLPERLQAPPATANQTLDPDAQVKRLLGQARALRYSGRYAEALLRMDRAIALRPGNEGLKEERVQTRASWERLQQELDDRELLLRTEYEAQRLPLLRQRVRAAPDDEPLRGEMERLDDLLQAQADALSGCGRRQADSNPVLARGCLELALQLRGSASDQSLLADLRPKPSAAPGGAAAAKASANAMEAPEAPAAPAENAGNSPAMIKAHALLSTGNLFGAIRLLESLHQQQRGSEQSRRLLQRTRSRLDQDTGRLLATGDELYQQGQVKEALAVWQAALGMDPLNADARRKSERALRVLSNMQALQGNRGPDKGGRDRI